MALTTINSGGIEDGSIVNADIKSDAAIAGSKLADNAVGLAQMASGTDGNLITYDASGDPAHVTTGTSGHILTSNGAGAAPTFQAAPTSGAALTGSTNDTVTTVTGANAIQGEATLKFTGNYLHLNHANGGISWGTGTPGSFGLSPSIAIAEQAGYHSTGSAVDDLVIGAKHQKAVIIGTTSNASGGLTTRFSVENGGDVQVKTGNLVIGTAGKGIDFSATGDGSGTMSSELLDDYEEGTFTGTWTAYTTACSTTDTSTNYYTKIGQQVTCYINASNMTLVGGGGAIKMEGLPYATSSDSHGGATSSAPLLYKVGFDGDMKHTFFSWQSVSFFIGYQSRNGTTWQAWDITEWDTAGTYCQMVFTYRAAT